MQITVEDYARQCEEQGLRGDYSSCRADFTVAQGYDYTQEDQDVWRTLSARQTKLTEKLAHRSYLDGVQALGLIDRVPDFGEVSRQAPQAHRLGARRGARPDPQRALLRPPRQPALPGHQLAAHEEELDYIVEPDMFHDFFGHVPALTQPAFADFMQMYGEKAEGLIELGGDEMIGRLYWYTAEFALIAGAGTAAQGVRRRADVVLLGTAIRGRKPGGAPRALRSGNGHAHRLRDRQVPARLFRAAVLRRAARRLREGRPRPHRQTLEGQARARSGPAARGGVRPGPPATAAAASGRCGRERWNTSLRRVAPLYLHIVEFCAMEATEPWSGRPPGPWLGEVARTPSGHNRG